MKHLKLFEEFNVSEGLTAKQKKLPKALQDSILKKQGEKIDKEDKKEDEKECCGKKNCSCKDKNEKECCGKKNCSCKDKKENKGLTAAQKKLPLALQKAILKKK